MHYCIGLCYWFLSRWRVGVLRILPPTFNLSCNKLGCCRLWKVLQQNLYWLVCVLLAKANLFCSKWRTTYRVYIAWLPRNFIQLEVSILCFHYHALKNKNSNQLTQKVQNLGNKRRWIYTETPRQESGLCDVSYARYSEKRTQVWRRHVGVPWRGTNPTETSVFEFFFKCISPSLDELIKIKVIFILRQRIISLQNLKNSVTLFLTQKSFLGCQLRCDVTQKPRNSSVLYNKTKNNLFEPKIRRNKGV